MNEMSGVELIALAVIGLGCLAYIAMKARRFLGKGTSKGGCGSGCGCGG
jgi:hypothetical protein